MTQNHLEHSVLRCSPVVALLVVVALAAGPCALPNALAQDPPAGQANSQARGRDVVRDLVIVAPHLSRRCHAFDMNERPADLADLEARVSAWIATCVTSRTDDARREQALVHGNRSLAALWTALPAEAQRIRIVPRYVWSDDRVTRVDFSSPDVPRAPHTKAAASRPRVPGAKQSMTPATSAAGDPSTKTAPVAPPVDLMLPDDGQDILLDVRALIDRLREQGQTDDADKLERLANKAAKLLVSLGLLVGVYYVGTKFRAGKLLFMWGANAAGPHFRRALGRLSQLLPEVEGTLGQLVSAARPYVRVAGAADAAATGAGADIEWQVLDQIIDPSVPAQLDGAACGPACAQMLLEGRGIDIPQAELIERGLAKRPAEIKSKHLSDIIMRAVLEDVDPTGGWTSLDKELDGKSPRHLLEALGAKGPWMAQVGRHFVVIDRLDSRTGQLFVRDPWYGPAAARGIKVGTHYRVSAKTFFKHWIGVAVYRK